jgi:hypothetical protein
MMCMGSVAMIRVVLVCWVALWASAVTQGPAHARIEILTSAENATIAPELLVARVTGEIEPGTAEKLRDAWSSRGPSIERVLVDLDSIGGEIGETRKLIAFIEEVRLTHRVDTLVRQGALCASACVAVFAQGERRTAGGASVWMFHGVCRSGSNVPSLAMTHQGLEILRKAGVRETFLKMLVREGYVTQAGALWASGYELRHVHDAGLITALLDPWQPEEPVGYKSDIAPRWSWEEMPSGCR